MIRVVAVPGGFRWEMIDSLGNRLVYFDQTVYLCNKEAARVACAYRSALWVFAASRERQAGAF